MPAWRTSQELETLFLAFDLFIGAWVCRTARSEGISFWLVVLCLPFIFLFGPAGLLAFQAIRAARIRISQA
ncbi:MAG: abscisic acid-deficient protein Aba4 family protein [Pseudomonadota bacterium]